jgi:prophage DNA circulation protein
MADKFKTVEEELFPASFRGIPFLFTDTSRSGGRKTVTHEYPNRNRRYIEDMGKSVPVYSITAIISPTPPLAYKNAPLAAVASKDGQGNFTISTISAIQQETYMKKRNAFINALETAGSGILVHPFYGSLKVCVLKYTVNESTRTLGVATFAIEFAETDTFPPLPTADYKAVDTSNLKTTL